MNSYRHTATKKKVAALIREGRGDREFKILYYHLCPNSITNKRHIK